MSDERDMEQGTPDGTNTHGKRVYLYFTLLLVLLVSLTALRSGWQRHVPVRQVSVEGISIVTKDEVVKLMNLPPNVPMYDVDLTAVQRNLLSNSFIRSAVIQRDAPSALRVTIEERHPAAILNAGELYFLASDGTVLPYVASTETYDIPVISGADSLTGIKAGQRLMQADIREALDIIAAAQAVGDRLFHSISEVRLRKGKDLVLYTFDTGIPVIYGKGFPAEKMVKLDAFWQQALQNGETSDIQYIDIRFDDQVVVSRRNS